MRPLSLIAPDGEAAMNRRRTMIAASLRQPTMAVAGAAAQGYPDRNVELVVPSTPGSSADILGRVLADGHVGAAWAALRGAEQAGRGRRGRDRRGRAGQARRLHADARGRSVADGRAVDRASRPATPPSRSKPICQTFKNDQVIVARPNTYKNVADLVAASKAKPGGLNLRQPGARHDPAPADDRAVATHQGRIQPRAVPGTGGVDPDDPRRARSTSRCRR